MANDTSRKPWSLDTAAVITTDRLRIKRLDFNSGAGDGTANETCTVEDANGERIAEFLVTGNNFQESKDFGDKGQDFQGLEVAVIDGTAILYVYLA